MDVVDVDVPVVEVEVDVSVVEVEVDVSVVEVEVVVVVDCVDVVGASVEVVGVSVVPGADPHPTRFALTIISSNNPAIVVAAPPKLSTPKPIQSRDCGKLRPAGTFEPIPLGCSQVTALPST